MLANFAILIVCCFTNICTNLSHVKLIKSVMVRERRMGIGQQKNEMFWNRQDFQPVNYQPQQVAYFYKRVSTLLIPKPQQVGLLLHAGKYSPYS